MLPTPGPHRTPRARPGRATRQLPLPGLGRTDQRPGLSPHHVPGKALYSPDALAREPRGCGPAGSGGKAPKRLAKGKQERAQQGPPALRTHHGAAMATQSNRPFPPAAVSPRSRPPLATALPRCPALLTTPLSLPFHHSATGTALTTPGWETLTPGTIASHCPPFLPPQTPAHRSAPRPPAARGKELLRAQRALT